MNRLRAIEGCRKDDLIAQKWLFDAYSDGMLVVCMRYVKHLPDAEELMLNGFFKFFKNISTFVYSGDESVGGWLKKIMVNECLMFLRKKKMLVVGDEAVAEDIATSDDVLAGLGAAEIYKLVMDLPVGFRTVFNLYVVEGYTHREIAEALNITDGTSKSQLNRARAALQKELVKNGITP